MSFFYFLGQKKLGKVITPDTWKSGARNTTGITIITNFNDLQILDLEILVLESGGRKVGENKALAARSKSRSDYLDVLDICHEA